MAITGGGNYLEDLRPGDVFVHGRGRTVSELDNYLVTLMTLNTAQAHFNRDYMARMLEGAYRERLVMGAVTMAICIGLSSEDLSENAIAELGYTAIAFPAPVFHGDTLYAETEVLAVEEADRPDAGIVRCRVTGRKQDGSTVFVGERTLLVKRRSHWGERDRQFLRSRLPRELQDWGED
jgi:itaconyl-CoA hydratase